MESKPNPQLNGSPSEAEASPLSSERAGTGERTSELAAANQELQRLNRTLKVLSECNQVLIHAEQEPAFLGEVCRILVEIGGYRMAWVGYAEPDGAKTVRPVAHAGVDDGYLAHLEVTWGDDARGRGPTGAAIRCGGPVVNRDTHTDSTISPWREEQLSRGYASSIALPICAGSYATGALTIYAAEPEAFDENEVRLFSQLAGDLSFGIETLRTRLERQRAEDAARRASAEIQDLYNNAPCGYHSLSKEGLFLRINDTELQWLGYRREEVVDRLHWVDVVTEQGKRRFAQNFSRFVECGEAHDQEYELVRADGSTRPVLVSATAVRDEAGNFVMSRSTVYDRTEVEKVRAALKAERQRFFDVLETLPAMIFLLKPDYHVAFVNRSFREKFGESRDRHCYELCFGRSAPCEFCESYKVFETGRPHHWEVNAPDGSVIDAYDFPFTDADGSPMILEMDLDITDRKRSEAQVRDLNEALKRRVTELAAANRELEAFSYSVSHDLRAPLRSMNGFSQILLEDHAAALDSEAKKYLQYVRAASQRMDQLVDGILDLSRASRSEMRQTTVDMGALARTIALELEQLEPGRQVEFVVAPGLVVYADARLVRSLLQNLLGNAWKFTGKHPTARIELGRTEQDGETVYFVRDDGAGFDGTYAQGLFGAFNRLHHPSEFEGTGIGLAIVHRIIQRHGGRIWAEAKVEAGATFFFTLPMNTRLTNEEHHGTAG